MHEKCKACVELELKQVKYYDNQTYKVNNGSIHEMQHAINESFGTKWLQKAHFPEDHTGENLSQGLKEAALAAWLHDEFVGSSDCLHQKQWLKYSEDYRFEQMYEIYNSLDF